MAFTIRSRSPGPHESEPLRPQLTSQPRSSEGEPGPFLGAFFALLTGFVVFSYSGTDLLSFPDRPIGVGVLAGVDASRRFTIYGLIVASSLGVWLGCHYGSRILRRRLPNWFVGARSRLENGLCASLCAVGSVALVAAVAADRLDGIGPVVLALAGLGAVAAIALTRRLSTGRSGSHRRRQLTAWSTLGPLLLWPWPSAQIAPVLGDLQGQGSVWLVVLGTVLPPLGYMFVLSRRARSPSGATPARLRQALAVGAAPFFLFPSLCPIANEIQYTLAQRHEVAPRAVALYFLALLALGATVLFQQARRGRIHFRPGHLVAGFYFPAIVFGSALITAHQHRLTSMSHLLHDGERINSVYQLLRFGKWPFVDVWPAHGLSDYQGLLYAWVNDFRPFEIMAWNGALAAFCATATYAILAVVSTPFLAFVLAILLPIEAIYAEPALLAVGLLLCWTLRRPSLPRYASLSIATFLCFFWAPPSGVACILSVFILLVLLLICASDRKLAWRGLIIFLATGACVFVGYVALLMASQRPVFETLGLVRAFIQADPMIGGRATVLGDFDALAFLQYIVLPGFGLLYLSRLARKVIERRPIDRLDCLLSFLTLASLVLFARTLSRHGIIERFSPFYFPLLAMVLPMHHNFAAHPRRARTGRGDASGELEANLRRRTMAQAWFCVTLALYWVVFPVKLIKPLTLEPFELRKWKANETRFTGGAPDYARLKAFLDANLRPTDTFLEMLNAPLLYTLLEREVPGYFFFPTMFYATDGAQDIYLRRLEAFGGEERVPFVLLPGAAGRWNFDHIPNTARSYRIAEHVYRHYVPLGDVQGFEVWISRKRWEAAGRGVGARPLRFADPESYRAHSLEPPRHDGDALWLEPNGPDPHIDGVVDLEGVSLGGLSSHHGMRFLYRTSANGTIEAYFRYAGREYDAAPGKLTVQPSVTGEWQQGQISIPLQEQKLSLSGLRIDPPDEGQLELKDLELVYGDPRAGSPEKFSMDMLPFIWGNFDSQLGSGGGTVQESIALPDAVSARTSFELRLGAEQDKSSGNYLRLCIRVPGAGVEQPGLHRWQAVKHEGGWQSAGRVTLRYGAQPPSTFEFDLVRPNPHAPGLPAALVSSFARECKRYLIRLSTQYPWNSEKVTVLHLDSSIPIVLEAANLLKGD